ncbi:MAG: hypothetical protein ACU83N_13695 [Gammaproteobacteria bacterium]
MALEKTAMPKSANLTAQSIASKTDADSLLFYTFRISNFGIGIGMNRVFGKVFDNKADFRSLQNPHCRLP